MTRFLSLPDTSLMIFGKKNWNASPEAGVDCNSELVLLLKNTSNLEIKSKHL